MSLLEVATNLKLMLEEGVAENPKYSYDDLANEINKSKTWFLEDYNCLNQMII
ncbi:hypothetical protein [Acinetobacter baumannii]|uniref:hypothetical protein n=1 Tax=Acinetobacter baumannii TaxID=470 RepID=UPI001D19394D|nr:hypothetical protein [Acinetobacter baumannii]